MTHKNSEKAINLNAKLVGRHSTQSVSTMEESNEGSEQSKGAYVSSVTPPGKNSQTKEFPRKEKKVEIECDDSQLSLQLPNGMSIALSSFRLPLFFFEDL